MAELDAPFDEAETADDTYWAYVEDGGNSDPSGEEAEIFDGSMELSPSQIDPGAQVTISATVENTADEEMYGAFYPALEDPESEEFYGIAQRQSDQTLGAGESADIEFQIERGVLDLPDGEFDIYLMVDGQDSGYVDVAQLTVGDGASGSSGAWSDAELWGELAYGWYLFGQVHSENGEERMMIGAYNTDGTLIYLHPDGTAEEGEPAYYETEEEVAAALEAYNERVQSGEQDEQYRADPTAPAPGTDEVTDDADNGGGLSGLLSTKTLALAIVVVAAGGYYYANHYDGNLDIPFPGGN